MIIDNTVLQRLTQTKWPRRRGSDQNPAARYANGTDPGQLHYISINKGIVLINILGKVLGKKMLLSVAFFAVDKRSLWRI